MHASFQRSQWLLTFLTLAVCLNVAASFELYKGPGIDYCSAANGLIFDAGSSGKDDCKAKCAADASCEFFSIWKTGGVNQCRLTRACDSFSQQALQSIVIYKKTEVAYTLFKGPGIEYCSSGLYSESNSEGLEECQGRCTVEPYCRYFSIWATGSVGLCRLSMSCTSVAQQSGSSISVYEKPQALNQTCAAPRVGTGYNSSACEGLTRCQTCSVSCPAGTVGSPTTLQCLGEADEKRTDTTFSGSFVSWLEYSHAMCDATHGSDPVSFVFGSRCGLEPCCPLEPTRPTGCTNRLDNEFNSPGQCVRMMDEFGKKCEADFCPTCGTLAGFCDLTCGYGACAVCGDCWRESPLSASDAERCDDGNAEDGDGCSSNCTVEPGFTCTKADGIGADICEMCVDLPNWTDVQGYTCEDYKALDACDATSDPTDPVTPGGGKFSTPNYHEYTFVYDLALTDDKPMILYVEVQAEHDVHIFLGRPPGTPEVNLPTIGVHGFEIVIGGWNNGQSKIRRYPGGQDLSSAYGARLNASEVRHFWVYCSANGTLLVGEGDVLFNNRFLGGERGRKPDGPFGSGVITMDAQLSGWYYPVDQVSIATGWGSSGSWTLRLANGSGMPTLEALEHGGVDAAQACCFCGGGSRGRKCEIEDQSMGGPALKRVDVPLKAEEFSCSDASNRDSSGWCGQPCASGTTVQNGASVDYTALNHAQAMDFPCGSTFSGQLTVSCFDSQVSFSGECHQDCPGKTISRAISGASCLVAEFVIPAMKNAETMSYHCDPTPVGQCSHQIPAGEEPGMYGTVQVLCDLGSSEIDSGTCGLPCEAGDYSGALTMNTNTAHPRIGHNSSVLVNCPTTLSGTVTLYCDNGVVTVADGSCKNRLGGAKAIKEFSGDLMLLGEASADGFLVRIPVADTCAYSGPGWVDCYINAIVVPTTAAEHVILPLNSVWSQIRSSACRLRNYKLKRQPYSRWSASGCNLKAGSSYTLFMHLEPGTALQTLQFSIPSAPRDAPRSISFLDEDPKPSFVAGPVLVDGALDEAEILQYRLYWGRSETEKVTSRDPRSSMAGVVNTYSGGGFRNGFSNFCLYGDCQWKAEKAVSHRRRGLYRVRHEGMGTCFCQSPTTKALEQIECPERIMSLDHPEASRHEECLWLHTDVIVNRAPTKEGELRMDALESRMKNFRYSECVCQVPVQSGSSADGYALPALKGEAAVQVLIGKWCDASRFSYKVDNEPELTKGYCEWTVMLGDPSPMAKLTADAATTSMNLTDLAAVGSVTKEASWRGSAAWHLASDGNLGLTPSRVMGSQYTLAVWVDLQRLASSEQGLRSLFSARSSSGEEEPCLMVQQRQRIDDRPPMCPVNVCNGTQVDLCCGGPYTTTTTTTTSTTTTTTSTSTTTIGNETVPPANVTSDQDETTPAPSSPYECTCLCPYNESLALGDYLSGDHWALGLQSCGSEVMWDSGFDLSLPSGAEPGWMLIAAVGDGTSAGDGETVFYVSKPEEPETITHESEFGCAAAGCSATATIRNIGRDLTRTCALTVAMHITDYGDGLLHSNPEVVESITIIAGNPQQRITVSQNCHPDGENDHQRLFVCVRKYDIDSLVGGSTASRAFHIEIKISDAVDEFPMPNGDLLSGTATVVCKRVIARDRFSPPSGGLQKVGVAGRTCAGSYLEAIGGAASGTSSGLDAYIGQAWHFDRKLPEAELQALFHATRTRYYQDYKFNLENVGVVFSSPEARITGRVRCRKPGCEGFTVLKGLPTAQTSTCLLTVGVTMTDFSNDREYIEYIRLDGIDVVTNCQIGSDNTGEQWSYLCADNLDVSQQVLKAAYLNDGEIRVTAKITDEVDKYRTWENDLLDAKVTVHCVNAHMEEAKQSFDSVKVAPQTGHLIAVSANINGESEPVAVKLDDRVNGFIEAPTLMGPVSPQAAALEIKPNDPDGVIYAYAVRREDRHLVTRHGIVEGLPGLEICPQSHRRRGPLKLMYWRQDAVMSRCLFEPQVPYTLVMYVDTSDERIPQGGGSFGLVDIVGPVPGKTTGFGDQYRPVLRPQKVEFVDKDSEVRKVQGTVTIMRAYSEEGITNYYMYFGRDTRHLDTPTPTRLADIPTTGAESYSVYIHQTVPNGATHLIVFAVNVLDYPYLSRVCRSSVILDESLGFLSTPTLSQAPGNQELNRFRVGVQLSSPNVRIDIAVVKKGAEVNARPSQNHRSLDFRAIEADTVCVAENKMSDLASNHFDFGVCDVIPNTEYVVVVMASIRIECPCKDPCMCTGAMTTVVQAATGSELIHTATGFQQPDVLAPTGTLECNGCSGDRVLRPTLNLQDPGASYPVLAYCFACVKTTPKCVRHGDSEGHRMWRLRFKSWEWCENIDIKTLDFMELSVLSPLGEKVTGTAIAGATQVIKETSDPPQNVFDDSADTSYQMGPVLLGCYRDVQGDRDFDHYAGLGTWKECAEMCQAYTYFGRQGEGHCWCGNFYGKHGPQSQNNPCNCDPEASNVGIDRNCVYDRAKSYSATAWIGLDLGPHRKLAISFVNIKWNTDGQANCPYPWAEKGLLEWSDDGLTWSSKLQQVMSWSDYQTEMYPNPKLRSSDFDGSYYQTVFTGEGRNTFAISGLTPKITYSVECYLKDSAGNSAWGTPGDATTQDTTGPVMQISGFASVTDFAAHPIVQIKDPGNSYPALVKCFAREHVQGDQPPTRQMLSGKGQLCREIHAPASKTREGRVDYVHVLSAWLTHQDRQIRIGSKVFGYEGNDYRDETRSCGLRHESRNGPGGCGTKTTGVKQAARFSVAVKAFRDAHIFLGSGERGAVGYEITFGGWSNRKSAIRRGHSADRKNNDLKFGTIVADFGTGGYVLADNYGNLMVRHFWVSVDPNTQMVEVGYGEIFGKDVFMSYHDEIMPEDIDHLWAAGGHYSGGQPGFYGADFYICPKIGNLALNRPSYSHSVAFHGTADKAFDGQTGNGVFCEYCAQGDARHVCAQTRKGSKFVPPWIKVDLGKQYPIGSVRIVGPQPGEVLPAQTTVTIYAGYNGDRSDRVCKKQIDITGDNIFVCDDADGINGQWVSLYGELALMRNMPEAQGIRVCEVEVYEKFEENDEIFRAQKRYKRTTGLPASVAPPSSTVPVAALEPNTNYEVFCYGEDESGFGELSNPAYIKTTDNTPPTLKIMNLVPADYKITVNVELDDPGKAYPSLVRCAATMDGVIPQGHERYFEHRYWRMVFASDASILEEDCDEKLLVRASSLHAHGGMKLPGQSYSSEGPEARGSASFTDKYETRMKQLYDNANELAWELPGQSWIGFDMEARTDFENYLKSKDASVHGDLIISVRWNAPVNESSNLMLYVNTPDESQQTRDNPTVMTGLMDMAMQCQNMRDNLTMLYLGRTATCSGTALEVTWNGPKGNGATIEQCKARCLEKPDCTGFQLSHAYPTVGQCELFIGTVSVAVESDAYSKHMCYKKDGMKAVFYSVESSPRKICDSEPLHELGGRWGSMPEGVLESRTACQKVCTESPACNFYLWREDKSKNLRYHCEFYATCDTFIDYPYCNNQQCKYGSAGYDARIYKKNVKASLTEVRYYKTSQNHYCPEGEDITDQVECLQAAVAVGYWNGSYEGVGEHRYCAMMTKSGFGPGPLVRFNTAGDSAASTAATRVNLDSGTTYESICKVVEIGPKNCCQAARTAVPLKKIENEIDYVVMVSGGICEDKGMTTITDEDQCLEAVRTLRNDPLLERPWPEGGIPYTGAMNSRIAKGCNIIENNLQDAGYYPTAFGECGTHVHQCICLRRKPKVCQKEEYVESSLHAYSYPGTYEAFVRKMSDMPLEPPVMSLREAGVHCEGTTNPGHGTVYFQTPDSEKCKEHCLKNVDCSGFSYRRHTANAQYANCEFFAGWGMYVRPTVTGEEPRECWEKSQEPKEIDQARAFVKVCGEIYEFELNMSAEEENITIGKFEVPSRGCSRSSRSPELQSWQISSVPEGPEYGAYLRIADLAVDGLNKTCAETGGQGRTPGPSDDGAWWRTDLGGLVHVEAIWLAADHRTDAGAGARYVDVFVVEAQVTAVSDLYPFSLLVSGRWCDTDDGTGIVRLKETHGLTLDECKAKCAAHAECEHLSYKSEHGFCNLYKNCKVPVSRAGWDTYQREVASNYLCASNVLVGGQLDLYEQLTNAEDRITILTKELGVVKDQKQEVIALRAKIENEPYLYDFPDQEAATAKAQFDAIKLKEEDMQQQLQVFEDERFAIEQKYLSAPPLTVVSCAKALLGSHIWVFARDDNRGLTLCEVEVYITPMYVASEARFQFGSPPNGSLSVCGAQNASIEWSDDNVNWHEEWFMDAKPLGNLPQSGAWEWWSQLFALNFTATYDSAGVLPVVIPSLRPNSTYDVFCWATDAVGNDISRELVTLLRPWGQTTDEATTGKGYEGPPLPWRRLEGSGAEIKLMDGGGLQCTEAMREFIPCEDRILTFDRKPPAVASFTLAKLEEYALDSSMVPTERAFVEMALSDTSCENRQIRAVKCLARCQVRNLLEPKASADWEIEECEPPRCLEQRWSNEDLVKFAFSPLYGGVSYAVMCEMSDPWGNSHRERFEMHLPTSKTTSQAPSPVPMSTKEAWQEKDKHEKDENVDKDDKEESASKTTTEAKSKWDYWKPPAPSPEDDEDDGWITIGDLFTTTSTVRTMPRTTTTPGTFTTSWLLEEQTQPTTTEPTTTLPGAVGGTPPPPVQIVLSLGATSEADAQMLLRPSAISALVTALRHSMGLSADDAVDVQAAKIVAPSGRRLNESSVQIWEVRLRMQMRMIGQAHAAAVNSRLRELRDGSGNRRELLSQKLRSELTARSVRVAETTVLGASLQDDSDVTAERDTPSNSAALAREDTSSSGATSGETPAKKSSSATMWVIIASVAIVLIFVLVPAGAVCVWWACTRQRPKKEDLGRRPAAVAPSAKERRSSDGRRSRGSTGEQTSRPSPLQKLPVQAPNPSHGPVSPCKIAWASMEEERVETPASSISTASTRHSAGHHQSSSNVSAAPSTRTQTPGSDPDSIVGEIPMVKPSVRNSLLEEAVEIESCTSAVTSARTSTTAPLSGPAETAVVVAPASPTAIGPAPSAQPVAMAPAIRPGPAQRAQPVAMPPRAGAVARAMRDNATAAAVSSRMGALRQTEPVPAAPDTSGVPAWARGHRPQGGSGQLGHGSGAMYHGTVTAAATAVHWRGQAARQSAAGSPARTSVQSHRAAAHRGVHRSSSGGRQGTSTPPLLQ